MKKLGSYELTEWSRSAGGWFKYNIGFSENPMLAICLYHDKNEKWSQPKHRPNYEWQPMYNEKHCHIWTPVFSQTIHYLNVIFHKTYGKEFVGTEDEVKKFIDDFLIRINDLKVFY